MFPFYHQHPFSAGHSTLQPPHCIGPVLKDDEYEALLQLTQSSVLLIPSSPGSFPHFFTQLFLSISAYPLGGKTLFGNSSLPAQYLLCGTTEQCECSSGCTNIYGLPFDQPQGQPCITLLTMQWRKSLPRRCIFLHQATLHQSCGIIIRHGQI